MGGTGVVVEIAILTCAPLGDLLFDGGDAPTVGKEDARAAEVDSHLRAIGDIAVVVGRHRGGDCGFDFGCSLSEVEASGQSDVGPHEGRRARW